MNKEEIQHWIDRWNTLKPSPKRDKVIKMWGGKPLKQSQIKTFVGGYRLGESNYYTVFNLPHKPNWFHRTMMRFFFGMYWVDN